MTQGVRLKVLSLLVALALLPHLSTVWGRGEAAIAQATASALPQKVTALAVSQASGAVYAATASGLYRSLSAPYTQWIQVNSLHSVKGAVEALSPNPVDPQDLFLIAGSTAYHSTDGGKSFALVSIFTDGLAVASVLFAYPQGGGLSAATHAPRTLYASSVSGDDAQAARSDDDGKTWQSIADQTGYMGAEGEVDAEPDPSGPQAVWLITSGYHSGGIQFSSDGGQTWSDGSQPADASTNAFSYADFVAPEPDSSTVWEGWNGTLLARSTDHGSTWKTAQSGLPTPPKVTQMLFDPVHKLTYLYSAEAGPHNLFAWQNAGGWLPLLLPPLASPLAVVWKTGYLLSINKATGMFTATPETAIHPLLPTPLTATGSWSQSTPPSAMTNGQSVTVLGDGRVLVAGGTTDSLDAQRVKPSSGAQLFDPRSNKWIVLPPMLRARSGQAAALLADGRVLMVAGDRTEQTAEIFDPRTTSWKLTTPLPRSGRAWAPVRLADGRVFLALTYQPDSDSAVSMMALIFDPRTQSWSKGPAVTTQSYEANDLVQSSPASDGTIVVTGPDYCPGTETLDTYAYTLKSGRWSDALGWGMQTGASLLTLADGRRFYMGGRTCYQTSFDVTAGASIVSTAASSPKGAADLPTPRFDQSAVLLRDGRVLVAGGADTLDHEIADCVIYNPAANKWQSIAPLPEARRRPTLRLLRDGRVLVVGGGVAQVAVFTPSYTSTPANAAPSTDPNSLYIAASGHSVAAPFVATYRRLGLYLLGNPLTEAYSDHGLLTQIFDHMSLQERRGKVAIGDLGSALHKASARLAPRPTTAAERYFPQTGQLVSGAFLTFWQSHGAEAVLGLPLTGVLHEGNGDGSGHRYAVQWFTHARLELHPEIKDPRFKVLLGLLGHNWLEQQGWPLAVNSLL